MKKLKMKKSGLVRRLQVGIVMLGGLGPGLVQAALETVTTDLTVNQATSCIGSGVPAADSTGEWSCQTLYFDPFGDVIDKENQIDPARDDETVNRARRIVISVPAGFDPNRSSDLIIALHGAGGSDIDSREYFFKSDLNPASLSRFKFGTESGTAVDMARAEDPALHGDVVIAALNSGTDYDPVDQIYKFKWDVPDITAAPADLQAGLRDARRIVNFAREFRADNPNIQNVYVFGFSSGAIMTQTLACLYAAEFQGFGMNDFRLYQGFLNECGNYGAAITSGPVYDAMLLETIGGAELVPPSSIRYDHHPRPVFFTGGSHSTRWNYDVGDLSNPDFLALLASLPPARQQARRELADTHWNQHNIWNERNQDAIIDDRINVANRLNPQANNSDVLVPGRTDVRSTLEQFAVLLDVPVRYAQTIECQSRQLPLALQQVFCPTIRPDQASDCTQFAGDQSFFKVLDLGGARRDVTVGEYSWSSSNQRQHIKYFEVAGGGHYVPGRGNLCASWGATHDIDAGTEFIKFMARTVPGSNL